MVEKIKFTLGGLLLMLLATTANATLTMSVDRNPVGMDESFTLTLSSDESLDEDPDFAPLERLFDVVNRQQSSNFQMINGDITRSITWTLTLLPKESGTIELPPLSAGKVQSNPLTLQVREQAAPAPSQGAAPGEALSLQVEAEEGALYVQQQLLLTIKLLVAHDGGMSLGNGSSLSEPELEAGEAVIKRLGEDSNYQTLINGRRYSVIERRYAIYPQQSGHLALKPILFDGRMVEASGMPRSIFDAMQQRSRIKRVTSQRIEREVLPIPPGYQGRNWLPARSVQLLEQWPQQQQMVVGEPLTRTVGLLADGITSGQLPAIEQHYPDSVKSYPDQPQLKETPSEQGISAVRQEKVALVASTPGPLTLPPIEVHWWNTRSGQEEVAQLPARQLTVVAAAGGSSAVPPSAAQPQSQAVTPELPSPVAQPAAITPAAEGSTALASGDSRWQLATALLASGWLLTLLLWWLRARRTVSAPREQAARGDSLRQLAKGVKQGCHNHDAAATKQALLQWARLRWPENTPGSLGAMASRVEGELATAINGLSQALYGEAAGEWRGDALWQAFDRQREARTSEAEGSDLAPLFRHQSL